MAIMRNKNHAAYVVPGLERGIRLLQLFDFERRTLRLSDMARLLAISRSSAFRLAYTLEQLGFLQRDEEGRFYRLGAGVLKLGFEYLVSLEVVDVARPELELLRDETGASAHLTVREGREIIYLSRVPTRHHLTSNVTIGARRPAHATPMGRLLLSELSPATLSQLYPEEALAIYTEATPKTVQELYRMTREDRARGFVVSRGSFEAGGASVAAPVRSPKEGFVAAIDVSGPNAAFDMSELETRIKSAVVTAASRISRRLGWRGAD